MGTSLSTFRNCAFLFGNRQLLKDPNSLAYNLELDLPSYKASALENVNKSVFLVV